MNLLVVSDGRNDIKKLTDFFKDIEYPVDVVSNEPELFNALDKQKYDLLIFDIRSSSDELLETVGVIRNLKFRYTNSNVHVIAILEEGDVADKERCKEAGVNDTIIRPLDKTLFAEVADRCNSISALSERNAGLGRTEIDVEGIKKRLDCDYDFLVEIWGAFLEDLPNILIEMREAIESGNQAELKRCAHTLKGASANIGAEFLRQEALNMEQTIHDGDLNAAKVIFLPLSERVEAVIQELTGLIASFRQQK